MYLSFLYGYLGLGAELDKHSMLYRKALVPGAGVQAAARVGDRARARGGSAGAGGAEGGPLGRRLAADGGCAPAARRRRRRRHHRTVPVPVPVRRPRACTREALRCRPRDQHHMHRAPHRTPHPGPCVDPGGGSRATATAELRRRRRPLAAARPGLREHCHVAWRRARRSGATGRRCGRAGWTTCGRGRRAAAAGSRRRAAREETKSHCPTLARTSCGRLLYRVNKLVGRATSTY